MDKKCCYANVYGIPVKTICPWVLNSMFHFTSGGRHNDYMPTGKRCPTDGTINMNANNYDMGQINKAKH